MSLLSWDMFLEFASTLVNISDKLGDSWCLEENSNEVGAKYLKKIVTNQTTRKQCYNTIQDDCDTMKDLLDNFTSTILRWEYHVYYSLSYNVPVLCFNVWNESGNLLRLEEVWKHCQLTSQDPEQLYSALTQQDHPVLLRPFFTLHPCKTAEILNITDHQGQANNPIIRFLSAIGPMVNLELDIRYALDY